MSDFLVCQGDLAFRRVADDRVPKNAKAVKRVRGRLIVAEGEATGHHHAVAERQVELLTPDGVSPESTNETFLRIVEGFGTVTHEEHAPVRLEEGVYQVIRQTEYTPAEIRRVAD